VSSAPEKPPFITRLRHALIGRFSAPAGGPLSSTLGSAVSNATAQGMLGHAPEPGPFDNPPEQPIELDGPLPWELREDDK
jgi:hypothetical protein